MSAFLYLFLVLSPHLVFCYNIDTKYPIVYEDPEPTKYGNYFGYSAVLSFKRNSVPAWSLFVGAPRYSNGRGKVYRCSNSETRTNIGVTSGCEGLQISTASAPAVVDIAGRDYDITLRMGKTGWLGASMAMRESTNLTVCAPRSLVSATNNWKPKVFYISDMRGFCFYVPNGLNNIMYRDNDIILNELRYPNTKQINSMYGFSVDYSVKKDSYSEVTRMIGQPRLDQVEIRRGKVTQRREYNVEEQANVGYSVSSGYYFDSTELVYVAGAPGWLRTGKVTITETLYGVEKFIKGTVLGEYFGASLATGDFDGDGLDDLAVGAPHWGEVDLGRVYTFYGSTVGRIFERGLTLDGTVRYAQFGYTLAAADLDKDKYSDLVVSAPWEGSGVVYIFYGSPNFRMRHSSAGITQRIEPSRTMGLHQVKGFGFALSHSVDIDDNGYPDLAIGAYKSGHAIVLRSRPVIKTKLSLVANPRTLMPSPGQSFVVTMCVEYSGEQAPLTQEFKFQMTVDEVHRRVEGRSPIIFSMSCNVDQLLCRNQTIRLRDDIVNVVDDIPVRVRHNIKEKDVDDHKFCSSCPVLSKKGIKEIEETTVYFNTGCSNSAICNAHLYVDASFKGISTNNEWVVGSGDISLEIVVSNMGDPAYQTQVTIALPAKIGLRHVVSTCISDTIEDAITLVCQIGNPIRKGDQTILITDLDMGSIVESAGGTELPFTITRSTRSEDHGTDKNPIILNLIIKNQAWIILTGLADQESQDYSLAENKSMVPIRHSYHIFKVGETPIRKAQLTINVPVAIVGENRTFLNITSTSFTDSTAKSCTIHGDDALTGLVPFLIPHSDFEQRRRRDISDATDTSVTTDEPDNDEELRNDNNGNEVTVNRLVTERIIHLNCTTKDVLCVEIVCQFKLSKTSNDSATLALDAVFNANAFYKSNKDSLTVKFRTNADVRIILPKTLDPTFIQHSNTTAEVSTMLYNMPEPEKLAGWVYPCSIILGILLFCLLVFILVKVGFFNRPKKEKTAKAKERDLILKVGGNGDGDDENYG